MKRFRFLLLLLLVVLLAVGAFFLLRGVGSSISDEQAQTLSRSLTSAAVEYYAANGRYPDTLEELCEVGGVVYSEKQFHVSYDRFADNVLPQIDVYPLGGDS